MGAVAEPRSSRSLLWGGTIAMVAGTLFAEALPVLLGVGADAKADWGFAYVTLHFVVLPALAVFLIGACIWSAVAALRRHQRAAFVPALSAAVVSLAYLIALACDQGFWARSLVK